MSRSWSDRRRPAALDSDPRQHLLVRIGRSSLVGRGATLQPGTKPRVS